MDLNAPNTRYWNPARLVVATAVLVVIALLWNALLHLVVLRADNAVIQPLRRTDLPHGLLGSLLLIASLCALFVFGYSRLARENSLREGVGYGLFFGVLAGLLVDLNQYLLYPIPGVLAAKWFAGGLVEFTFYGIILTRLAPLPEKRGTAGDQTTGSGTT